MSSIDFDNVLLHIGERGRYQTVMYYLLCIPATIPAAFLAFSQVFVSASPDHWCRIPSLEQQLFVFQHIGDRSRCQTVVSYLLYIPASIPGAFLAFSQVFVSASPDHWCRTPSLEQQLFGIVTEIWDLRFELRRDRLHLPKRPNSLNKESEFTLNVEQQRSIGIPFTLLPDGRREYDRCFMYDVDLASWLTSQNVTGTDSLPSPDPTWPVVKCAHGWNYDRKDYDSTLVTELDLVCDDGWWPSTSTTFFYLGSLFGNVVFGWIADKWGRRVAFINTLLLVVFVSILTSFSPNYLVYTILRTINGLSFPAIFQIPFILTLEMMGPRYRTFAGMVICMFFALAMSLLALLGYILRNWYTLSLATSVPLLLLLSYYWIIPESPRWLLSNNRIDEAEVIVQQMAKINKKPIPPDFLRNLQNFQEESQRLSGSKANIQEKSKSSATPMDILRYPNIRSKFFILAFDWVANAVVYNGLSYNTTNLGVSDYLAFFISAAVEIPSYIITWYAMDRWGRRNVLCLTMLLGGLACVSCVFVPEDAVWVTVSLAMIGKFGIAGSFSVFYVFVGELLPTVLRSQAMGIASFIAGIGLLGFPAIVGLAKYSRVLPLIIMGSLSVAGALVSVFLPETLNIHLPQTLEEGEMLKAKFNICPKTKPQKNQNKEELNSIDISRKQSLPNGVVADEPLMPINVIVTNYDEESQNELQ